MYKLNQVKQQSTLGKQFPCPGDFSLALDKKLKLALDSVGWQNETLVSNPLSKETPYFIQNKWDVSLEKEEFVLEIGELSAVISHSSPNGFHYGLQWLAGLKREKTWACQQIQDAPSVGLRGALLDIGRDKIPKMETLLEYIQFLGDLRYNHIQFYMEGFSFDFPRYRPYFPGETPLTGAEIRELTDYATSLFIDLVPNQNCLGHMEQWLALPQFNDMAECPDGFLFQNIYKRPPMTLDVSDPRVLDLVNYFLQEMLPHFKGDLVNVNLDEPFELGIGKNKVRNDKEGSPRLYLEFILKIHEICNSYGKRMMIWGDVIFHHPEIIPEIPEDIILLDWIYEGAANFAPHCEALQQVPHEFCLCPGTSTWASFAGRSDNMVKNINDAVENVVKYKGKGVIVTDWGDCGHWQYFTFSQIPFVCGGQSMWTGKPISLAEVKDYINGVVFQDSSEKIGHILYELGNYYQYEQASVLSTTVSFSVISSKYPYDNQEGFREAVERLLKLSAHFGEINHIPQTKSEINYDMVGLHSLLENTLEGLANCQLHCEKATQIKEEIALTVAFIAHGAEVYRQFSQENLVPEEFETLFHDLDHILQVHYKLWMARNKQGGFARSSRHLFHLLSLYSKLTLKCAL